MREDLKVRADIYDGDENQVKAKKVELDFEPVPWKNDGSIHGLD